MTVFACCCCPCVAVKEAAIQRRHNLYRDSIILSNSDPNLLLLGEAAPVDWASKFGGSEGEGPGDGDGDDGRASEKRRKQVVSMIQLDGVPLPYESCQEVPGVELIPEEEAETSGGREDEHGGGPKSPDSVYEIRDLIDPVVEMMVSNPEESQSDATNETEPTSGTITAVDGTKEDMAQVPTRVDVPRRSVKDKSSSQTMVQQLLGNKKKEANEGHEEETAIEGPAVVETETAAQEDGGERVTEVPAAESDSQPSPNLPLASDSSTLGDSSSPTPTGEEQDGGESQPIKASLNGEDKIIKPDDVKMVLV